MNTTRVLVLASLLLGICKSSDSNRISLFSVYDNPVPLVLDASALHAGIDLTLQAC